jgi:hypothetical protein
MPVYVEGLAEVSRAFRKTDRDTRLGFRHLLRDVASPIARDAEVLAQSRITRIGRRWWRMRTGVTRSLVYVAPRERGTRRRGQVSEARRAADRKFAAMLMDRAMDPALRIHEPGLERQMEQLMETLARDFNMS